MIAEDCRPFGEVAIGCDDSGGPFVAVTDDLIQVCLLLLTQGAEPDVIQDQKSATLFLQRWQAVPA